MLRAAAWAACAAALVVLRPAHLDGAWAECAAVWAYVWVVVALPGVALRRLSSNTEAENAVALAVWGLVYGVVLHLVIAEVLLRMGAVSQTWLVCVALGFVAAWRVWRRSTGEVGVAPPSSAKQSLWWLGLVAVLVLRAHHREPSLRAADYDTDLLWHAGNAAEYLRGPLMWDPRVAGLAFEYHTHAYALPAVAARTLDLPIASVTMSWLASLIPVLVVLATAMWARQLGGWKAGVVAGCSLLLATDPALALWSMGWEAAEGWRSHAYFEAGLWNSPTTSFGLVLFVAALERVQAYLTRPRFLLAVQVLVCAWAMAGAKGSTAPVLVAGLWAASVWSMLRTRSWKQPLFVCALCVSVGVAPAFVRLSGNDAGYAQAMFEVEPFAAFVSAPLVTQLAVGAWVWLVFPLWLLLFFGPALLWSFAAKGHSVLWWCALAGVCASLLVAAAGHSQLFFAYNSVLCIAVLGGVGFASLCVSSTRVVLLLAMALPLWLCGAVRIVIQTQRHFLPRSQPAAAQVAWFEGLRTLRTQSATDALVLARSETLLVSAYAERRTALETPRFTPQWHAARRAGRDPRAPFQPLAAEVARALAGEEAARLSLLRKGHASELWLLEDDLRLQAGHPVWGSRPIQVQRVK